MKSLIFSSFAALLILSTGLSANATAKKGRVLSLAACESKTLSIELNVGGATPKIELIEAIKVLSDYSFFSIRPARSEQSSIKFLAQLNDGCQSRTCAQQVGWNDLQLRLKRFKGVEITCAPSEELPSAARQMPGGGSANQPGFPPPPPGRGGVTTGN